MKLFADCIKIDVTLNNYITRNKMLGFNLVSGCHWFSFGTYIKSNKWNPTSLRNIKAPSAPTVKGSSKPEKGEDGKAKDGRANKDKAKDSKVKKSKTKKWSKHESLYAFGDLRHHLNNQGECLYNLWPIYLPRSLLPSCFCFDGDLGFGNNQKDWHTCLTFTFGS